MTHDYTFSSTSSPTERQREAHKLAMDIRKFEIELYWKRAAYFWTFIAVTLAAYAAVLTARQDTAPTYNRSDILFAIASIGFVFSVAWYFVNRGSKFWQRNWEFQADVLEDAAVGPLYKTAFVDDDLKFLKPTGAYPFSVSALNLVLNLFVMVVFLLLALNAIPCYGISSTCEPSWPKIAFGVVSAIFVFLLYWLGRAKSMLAKSEVDRKSGKTDTMKVRAVVRTVTVTNDIEIPAPPAK